MKHAQQQDRYEQIIQDGLSYHARGDRDRAIDTLGSAIALDPYCSDAFAYRGAIWSEYGEYARAERDLRAALAIQPCAMASYHLAFILSDHQHHSEAIEILESVLPISTDSELWHLYGIILDRANEPSRAIDALSKAIQYISTPDGELFTLRGILYAELGQWRLASKDFEAAITFGNRSSEVFYHQGIAYLHLSRWAEAATGLTRALPDDPHNPAIYQARSIAFEALGEKEYARQDKRMAMRLGI